MKPLDILAIAAHRDDVEQTCGGTLLKHAQRGLRTGILDLTRGEMGTRGTASDRAHESAESAKLLQVSWRGALDLPDGRVENTWENRLKIAYWVRALRPRVVILPYWQGRHPDHYTTATLGYEACFAAGLKKLQIPTEVSGNIEIVTNDGSPGFVLRSAATKDPYPSSVASDDNDRLMPIPEMSDRTPQSSATVAADDRLPTTNDSLSPHRPVKILYAALYADVRPTFVVDITAQFELRTQSLFCYKSQYQDQQAGAGLFPEHAEIRARLDAMARFYGLLAGVDYAEPFIQKEVGLVEDLLTIPVQSI